MLRFIQFLLNESIEQQLAATRKFEAAAKKSGIFNPNANSSSVVGQSVPFEYGASDSALAFSPETPTSVRRVPLPKSTTAGMRTIGLYRPGGNISVADNLSADEALETLRHEVGGHAYQDLAQQAQGRKAPNENLRRTSPGIYSGKIGRAHV